MEITIIMYTNVKYTYRNEQVCNAIFNNIPVLLVEEPEKSPTCFSSPHMHRWPYMYSVYGISVTLLQSHWLSNLFIVNVPDERDDVRFNTRK